MLTAAANPAGGFVFAGEFYEACRSFLARTVARSNSFAGGFKDCSYAGPLSQWEQEQQRDSYPISGGFR